MLDSGYSWLRLLAGLVLGTIGGAGMWSVVVILPAVQKEFGLTRADASLAYTLTMIGFGCGGILMGRIADRLGIFRPLVGSIIVLSLGYAGTAYAPSHWLFGIAYGLLIAMLGSAITFGPLIADSSLWFEKRRGIAVAVAASGNYLAGTIWPPIIEMLVSAHGWRQTHLWIGAFCLVTMLPLSLLLRARAPSARGGAVATGDGGQDRPLGLSRNGLTAVLCAAGVACCVAMAMPQVHIVAYCGDLGYGVARGAEMLSIMLAFGIVSRIVSGFIADRIGGLRTLLLGAVAQGLSLSLFLFFDGMASLYVLSALFGLMQGGIVPSYAVIVREHFPAKEVGVRVGIVLFATLIGMAGGGWVSGLIFDMTGSYAAAFLNGVAWNAVNVVIVTTLLLRGRRLRPAAGAPA